MSDERTTRLYALKRAAEDLANPNSRWGMVARDELPGSTGLSREGVDYALRHCLEHEVARGTLSSLARRAPQSKRAHVLLSSNVFTAAFRAIVLALCQSDKVFVRPSRRDPIMTYLLQEASDGAFEIVDELQPSSGDHYWAYGGDETLRAVASALPSGVHFHGHGYGLGLAIFREDAAPRHADIVQATRALSLDICAFDQRGCLSPRLLIIDGGRSFAETVCDLLVEALEEREKQIPLGSLTEEEKADVRWHRDTLRFVGSSAPAGKGLVFLDPVAERMILPPVGRHLSVTVTANVVPLVKELGPRITTVGFFQPGHLPGVLFESIGPRRFVDVGKMQTPPLDGPVDLRAGWSATVT